MVDPKELRTMAIPPHPMGVLQDVPRDQLEALSFGQIDGFIKQKEEEFVCDTKQARLLLGKPKNLLHKHKERLVWAKEGARNIYLVSSILALKKFLQESAGDASTNKPMH